MIRFKASWLLFGLVWLGGVGWGYHHYVPRSSQASIFRTVYRSSAVLYIRPSAWSPFGAIYRQRGLSPIDIWFTDTAMIQHLIERRQLGKRAAAKLAPGRVIRPEIMEASILVTPVSRTERLKSLFLNRIGEENSKIDDTGQLVPRVQRISFVRLEVFGADPAESKAKAEAFVQVFQEVMGELATDDLQRKTKQLTTLLTATEKKLSRSKLAWREREYERVATDEQRLIQLQRDASDLRARIRTLQQRAENLRRVLAQGGVIFLRSTGLLAASDSNLQVLQHNLNAARQIYQPDSERVQILQEQVDAFKRLRQMAQGLDADSQIEQETRQLRSLERLLRDNEVEQAHIAERRPPAATQISRAKRSEQIDMWDRQILDWQKQLFQLRLLLRLGQADGSSEVIQRPRAGVPGARYGMTWQRRYKGFLAWLPLATFLAFLAGWAGAIYDRSLLVVWRVEKYLDLKVAEVLPVIRKEDNLAWINATREG